MGLYCRARIHVAHAVCAPSQCIGNLEKVLRHAGAKLEDIAKVNSELSPLTRLVYGAPMLIPLAPVFLKDMADFPRVNAVYEKLMPVPKPARSCVQVAQNPGDVRIEIECIAKAP